MPAQNSKASMGLDAFLSQPPSNKSIINMDAIVEQCGGDINVANGILERFKEQAITGLKQMDASFAACDVETFRRAADAIKSWSACIGASVAAELCRQLETIAQGTRLEGAAPILNALHQEINCVLEWIQTNASRNSQS